MKTALELPDYASTVGVMRNYAEAANHAQPGNPAKLAEALMTLANAANPPLRLALGSDAVARIEAKHSAVEQELARWRALSLSTDFAS